MNIGSILDKCEIDGHIQQIGSLFNEIFEKEVVYAVSELKKLKTQSKDFDLEGHFLRNTNIFKENLKLITLITIENTWKRITSKDSLSDTIKKATSESYKGPIQSIKELEEEQLYKSQTVSHQEPDRDSLNLFEVSISNQKASLLSEEKDVVKIQDHNQ